MRHFVYVHSIFTTVLWVSYSYCYFTEEETGSLILSFFLFFFCNKGEQYHRYPLCLKVVFGYLPTSSLLIGMVTCTTLAVKSQRRRSFNGNKTKWLNVGKALPFTSIVIKMEGVSLGLYFISRC